MVNFPVFERVCVKDYALYEGTAERPGLDHSFVSGVNVIVGINGLGKTTLLNILLRSLTGAVDVPGGDDQLGDKRRRVVPSDRYWFRKRVPDDAVDAKVSVWFSIGSHQFEVVRSLANLDLLELSVDGQVYTSVRAIDLESEYRFHVVRSSGLASFDDFVFLMRYVVFYLEDRKSLVWDSAAQGDVLGILFGGKGQRRKDYVESFNELLSKDSEYRNMHAVVTKQRRKVTSQANSIEGGQIERLIQQLDNRKKQLISLGETKRESAAVRESLRQQIENRKLELHEKRSELAVSLNNFYESFFPKLSDSGRYLLAYFEADVGCLVCGSKDSEASKRVIEKLNVNTCPVCESPFDDSKTASHDYLAGEKIEMSRIYISKSERELERMLPALQKADQEYSKAAADLAAVTVEAASLEKELDAFGASLPEALEKSKGLREKLFSFEIALNEIEVERAELAKRFGELARSIDKDVRAVSEKIEYVFRKYIQGFLAEECQIKYTSRQSRVGQRTTTENFPFPHFIPALTSGVHRDLATVREAGQSVSESQKEFIDLAFRMAILELSAPSSSTMLVLETPEASLDSVFIPRAADLLRRFATIERGEARAKLIASSNVNREQMIPALFGAYPDQKFYHQVIDNDSQEMPAAVSPDDRKRHVLDLLSIAAPTRALDRFRLAYEEERDRAIYPEKYAELSRE